MSTTIITLTSRYPMDYFVNSDTSYGIYARIYAYGWYFGIVSWFNTLSLGSPLIPREFRNFFYYRQGSTEDFDSCYDDNKITILGYNDYEGDTSYHQSGPKIVFYLNYGKIWYDTLVIKQLLVTIKLGVSRSNEVNVFIGTTYKGTFSLTSNGTLTILVDLPEPSLDYTNLNISLMPVYPRELSFYSASFDLIG